MQRFKKDIITEVIRTRCEDAYRPYVKATKKSSNERN